MWRVSGFSLSDHSIRARLFPILKAWLGRTTWIPGKCNASSAIHTTFTNLAYINDFLCEVDKGSVFLTTGIPCFCGKRTLLCVLNKGTGLCVVVIFFLQKPKGTAENSPCSTVNRDNLQCIWIIGYLTEHPITSRAAQFCFNSVTVFMLYSGVCLCVMENLINLWI